MNQNDQAFWSYAKDDDRRLSGYVIRLAERLSDEYSVCSGKDMQVLVDRGGIEWGDAWHQRIDSASVSPPFFLPIITPTYIQSAECRREFLAFSASAKSGGFTHMLIPIVLISPADLREDSTDEVVATLAQMQYFDWTSLRMRGESDPAVRTALNGLVQRMIQLSKALGNKENGEVSSRRDEPLVYLKKSTS